MSKSSKGKKNKVHKLTEEEYAAYISSLKDSVEGQLTTPTSAMSGKIDDITRGEKK